MDNETLKNELEQLKRKIRIQWAFMVCFLLFIGACAFQPSKNVEHLTVKSLTVVDENGKVQVKIGADPILDNQNWIQERDERVHGGLIYLLNTNGRVCLKMGINQETSKITNIDTFGGGIIHLSNNVGRVCTMVDLAGVLVMYSEGFAISENRRIPSRY